MSATKVTTRERDDLLQTLAGHRFFLRFTVRELSDEQARQQTTVSALSLGGLIKHVAAAEAQWARFILEGAVSFPSFDLDAWGEAEMQARQAQFTMGPDETLPDLLEAYEIVAGETDRLVAELPDLDVDHPLPAAPWFEPDARWSARRALLHIIAETAQHAGHADIIRESLDGAKTMG
ncbi:MAG: DinB superfamily protein [Frankiales bacterium]|nr:DinB superfamily protein [Frankiales bacterium]